MGRFPGTEVPGNPRAPSGREALHAGPVQHILAQRVESWPLSGRSIYYAPLNDPPLRHAGKPDSLYTNDRVSYHNPTDLLSRAWPNARVQRRRFA